MTCARCKYWKYPDYGWGECTRQDVDNRLMRSMDDGLTAIETHKMFGCVQFAAKEPVSAETLQPKI